MTLRLLCLVLALWPCLCEGGSLLGTPHSPVKVLSEVGISDPVDSDKLRYYSFSEELRERERNDDEDDRLSKDPFEVPSLDLIAQMMRRRDEGGRGGGDEPEHRSGGGGWGRPRPRPPTERPDGGGWGRPTEEPPKGGWGRPTEPPKEGWGWAEEKNNDGWGQGGKRPQNYAPKYLASDEEKYRPIRYPPTATGNGGGGWNNGGGKPQPPTTSVWTVGGSDGGWKGEDGDVEGPGKLYLPPNKGEGGGLKDPPRWPRPLQPQGQHIDKANGWTSKWEVINRPGDDGWGENEPPTKRPLNKGKGWGWEPPAPPPRPPPPPPPTKGWGWQPPEPPRRPPPPPPVPTKGWGWEPPPRPRPSPPPTKGWGWDERPPTKKGWGRQENDHHHHHHGDREGDRDRQKSPFEYKPGRDDLSLYTSRDVYEKSELPPGIVLPHQRPRGGGGHHHHHHHGQGHHQDNSIEDIINDDPFPKAHNHYRIVPYTPSPEEIHQILNQKFLASKPGGSSKEQKGGRRPFTPSLPDKDDPNNKEEKGEKCSPTCASAKDKEKWFQRNFQNKGSSSTSSGGGGAPPTTSSSDSHGSATSDPMKRVAPDGMMPNIMMKDAIPPPPSRPSSPPVPKGIKRGRYDAHGFKYIPFDQASSSKTLSNGKDIYENGDERDSFKRDVVAHRSSSKPRGPGRNKDANITPEGEVRLQGAESRFHFMRRSHIALWQSDDHPSSSTTKGPPIIIRRRTTTSKPEEEEENANASEEEEAEHQGPLDLTPVDVMEEDKIRGRLPPPQDYGRGVHIIRKGFHKREFKPTSSRGRIREALMMEGAGPTLIQYPEEEEQVAESSRRVPIIVAYSPDLDNVTSIGHTDTDPPTTTSTTEASTSTTTVIIGNSTVGSTTSNAVSAGDGISSSSQLTSTTPIIIISTEEASSSNSINTSTSTTTPTSNTNNSTTSVAVVEATTLKEVPFSSTPNILDDKSVTEMSNSSSTDPSTPTPPTSSTVLSV